MNPRPSTVTQRTREQPRRSHEKSWFRPNKIVLCVLSMAMITNIRFLAKVNCAHYMPCILSSSSPSYYNDIDASFAPPMDKSMQQNGILAYSNDTNWPEVLWRPEVENISVILTNTPVNASNTSSSWRGYRPNRVIAFVHVGKAGGTTLRKATALICDPEPKKRPVRCLRERFPRKRNERQKHVLALQTLYYFHLWRHRPSELNVSTSFLISLRSPIDRIVSAYRYAHPQNCNNRTRHFQPWACDVQRGHLQRPKVAIVYKRCFPSASMELFAQSAMSPYPSKKIAAEYHQSHNRSSLGNSMYASSAPQQEIHCRKIARDMLQGHYPGMANPHMNYNYEYYYKRSIEAFPGREIFGIRTEHEWDDIVELDKAIGGDGKFLTPKGDYMNHHHSWGSEAYEPSPLSGQAIQKLCCLLEREIGYYFKMLDHVLNLDEESKQDSKRYVRNQCGLEADDMSWATWRRDCQRRLDADNETITYGGTLSSVY